MLRSETTKTCRLCLQALPLERFYLRRGKSMHKYRTPVSVRMGICQDCHKAKSRVSHLRRRGALIWGDARPPLGTSCGICGTTEPRGKGSFHLDHDHDTGVIRSWCCHDCNTGLGSLKDSPDVLAAGIIYLHRHGRALSTEAFTSLLDLNADRKDADGPPDG